MKKSFILSIIFLFIATTTANARDIEHRTPLNESSRVNNSYAHMRHTNQNNATATENKNSEKTYAYGERRYYYPTFDPRVTNSNITARQTSRNKTANINTKTNNVMPVAAAAKIDTDESSEKTYAYGEKRDYYPTFDPRKTNSNISNRKSFRYKK